MTLGTARGPKLINDQIHGHIELDETLLHFVDTPQFQRLRDLKQLGSAYYVFPGASHNRFEHSIGVSHLAGKMLSHLKLMDPALDVTHSDMKCMKLAGLCHDLGHGPFSHVFDNEFIPSARPGIHWSHEQMSESMLDYLIEDNGIESVDETEIKLIKSLISGDIPIKYNEKAYLFDIVANKRNSLDVDKFDYVSRDSKNLSVSSNSDVPDRLLVSARVRENQICYPLKESYNISLFCQARYSLFKRVYTHKTGKAIEYMLTEAMLKADTVLDISSSIDSPQRFLYLTDSIIKEIERSRDDRLSESRELIRRIQRRDLFKLAGMIALEPEALTRVRKGDLNPEVLSRYAPRAEPFCPDDCVVEWLEIHHGMKDKNPLEHVKFFNKYDNVVTQGQRNDSSTLLPTHFQESIIRVFAKRRDHFVRVNTAFYNWIDAMNLPRPPHYDDGDDDEHNTLASPTNARSGGQSASTPTLNTTLQSTLSSFTPRNLLGDLQRVAAMDPRLVSPFVERGCGESPVVVVEFGRNGTGSVAATPASSHEVPAQVLMTPSRAVPHVRELGVEGLEDEVTPSRRTKRARTDTGDMDLS